MRASLHIVGFSMLLAAAAPARACLAEPLPEAVLFDVPPSRPPPGYEVVRVVAAADSRDRGGLRVTFVDPALRRRLGASARLVPERATSCTGWGRLGSRAFVVARVEGRRGQALLHARAYARSAWDRWWGLLGIARYTPR